MALKIIMAVLMLPILPIMFGAFWFLAGEKNGMQFGVTLWKGAREQQKAQEIERIYKKELKGCAFICLLMLFLVLLPEHESLVVAGITIWVFLSIVLFLLPFQRANRRMKEQKREYLASLPEENQGEREEVLVDVTAAGARKPELSWKGMCAGGCFAMFAPIAEIFLYHFWRRPWLPELWVCELTVLSMSCAALLFPLCFKFSERQGTRPITYNSQVNLQVAAIRRYHWGRFCTVMAWLTGLFSWGMLCSFHVPQRWFLWLVGAMSLIFGAVTIALLFCCWQKIEKSSGKYLAQELPVQEDDDRYWIWGMFYYNKNDSRTMVSQWDGLGFTANMAKPGVKYAMATTVVFLAVGMFGACGWVIMEDFTPVSLSYQDGILTAGHWKDVYKIEKADIKQVVLLEEKPEIRRKSGTEMETVEKGSFYSDTYQRDIKVCLNPKEPPFLMIESADGKWYLLGGSDGEETRNLLNKIQP